MRADRHSCCAMNRCRLRRSFPLVPRSRSSSLPSKKMDAGSTAEFRVVCSAERSTGTVHAKPAPGAPCDQGTAGGFDKGKETMVRGRCPGKANTQACPWRPGRPGGRVEKRIAVMVHTVLILPCMVREILQNQWHAGLAGRRVLQTGWRTVMAGSPWIARGARLGTDPSDSCAQPLLSVSLLNGPPP